MNRPNITPDTSAPQGEQGSAKSGYIAGGVAVALALGAGGTAAVHHGADPTKLVTNDPTHEVTQELPDSIYDASGELRQGLRLKVAGDKLQPRDPKDGIVDIVEEAGALDYGQDQEKVVVVKDNDPSTPDVQFVIRDPEDTMIEPNTLANAVQAVPLAIAAEAERQVYGNPIENMPTPKPPHPNSNAQGGE